MWRRQIFCTCPDRVHPASCTVGTSSLSWGKQLRHANDHPSPFVAKIEERVALYFSLSGPS